MPISIKIEADLSDFRGDLRLSRKRMNNALRNAVNDTGRQVMTHSARAVARAAGFKVSAAKKGFWLSRATPRNLEADVIARGKAQPLMAFGARQTKKGVTAKAWGKRKSYAGSFIATMRSGHKGVFTRKGKARLPVKELWGPSVPGTFAQEAVYAQADEMAHAALQTNIGRQIDRALYAAGYR